MVSKTPTTAPMIAPEDERDGGGAERRKEKEEKKKTHEVKMQQNLSVPSYVEGSNFHRTRIAVW